MKPGSVAIVGAAETTQLGVLPNMSEIQMHAEAALNAMRDAGLKPSDIDGVATAAHQPQSIAHYLGITPRWVDGTSVGGCSFMLHVRHAAAAIESGMCKTVLITHGESGKSGIGSMRGADPATYVRWSVRIAVRYFRSTDDVYDTGDALHEDLWHDRSAIGDGCRGPA